MTPAGVGDRTEGSLGHGGPRTGRMVMHPAGQDLGGAGAEAHGSQNTVSRDETLWTEAQMLVMVAADSAGLGPR